MEHLKSIIYQQYIVDKQDLNMFLRINYISDNSIFIVC